MKKHIIAAVAGVLAVLLAGCGTDSKSKSDNNENDGKFDFSSFMDETDFQQYEHTVTNEYYSDLPETENSMQEEETEEPTAVNPTVKPTEKPEERPTERPTEKPTKPDNGKSNVIEDYEYAYAGFEPAYADMNVSDWRMILVNRDYILPDGYKPELENAVEGGYDDVYLDERVAPYYNEMYKAAYEDGIHLVPISGYRSVTRQKNNFERKINYYMDQGYDKVEATQKAATVILPPGTSEHNAGLAMDICSLEQDFEDTKEFEWLCENAADYGFILRYPEDKQDITRIIYEPWHWRYVGVEAAQEMKASGECLEEYLGVA